MAAERAAQSGSRVAGMVCSLRVLLLVSSVLALEGKREGVPENPHLLLQTQYTWEMGKIQSRQKKTKDIKKGLVRSGEGFRERLPSQLCSC